MASKIEGKAKVIVCSWNYKGPIYSRKLIFYSKDQLFHCFKELRLKTSRKERSNRRLSLLGSIGRFLELFDNIFEQRIVTYSFFYGAGSDRILGNDKGVGVPVFTNRKIKTTKKWNTPEWSWVKGQHRIRSTRLTLGFLSVAAARYGLNKKS